MKNEERWHSFYFYWFTYRIQENNRRRFIFTPFPLLVYGQIEDWVHWIGSNYIFRSRFVLPNSRQNETVCKWRRPMLTLSEDNPVYSNLHILELIFFHNFIGVWHVKRLRNKHKKGFWHQREVWKACQSKIFHR